MRENFSGKWAFALACIGSAVGLANVWAFPYRAVQFGGGAFLLAYAIIALFLGLVGVTGEICVGRWGQTGAFGTFKKAILGAKNLSVFNKKEDKNSEVSNLQNMQNLQNDFTDKRQISQKTPENHEILRSHSSLANDGDSQKTTNTTAHSKLRTSLSNIGIIPVIGSYAIGIGYAVVIGWILCYLFGTFSGELLDKSVDIGGFFGAIIGDFGSVKWHILALVITFFVLILGVKNGIETANKVMMPLFFLLFVALGIWVATLPNAVSGYRYLFVPQWEFLARPQTWIAALGQCFFSLSLAGCGTVVYGSYFGRSEDAFDAAKKITFFASITAVLASVVVIPAAFAYNVDLGAIKGPPLLFIILPEIFRGMPGGWLFGVLFFVAVLFAGVTSIINLFETPVEALQNRFGMGRLVATLLTVVLAAAVGVFLENANVVGVWMDVVSIYIIPLGALISAVVFFWVLGRGVVLEEVNLGRTKRLGSGIWLMGKFLFVPVVVVVLVLGIVLGGL